MCIVKCKICKDETGDTFPYCEDKHNKDIFVCEVCKGKFGNKIKNKLIDLDVEFEEEIKDMIVKPFTCTLKYEGGTKQDIINMIVNLMDVEHITLNQIEENRF